MINNNNYFSYFNYTIKCTNILSNHSLQAAVGGRHTACGQRAQCQVLLRRLDPQAHAKGHRLALHDTRNLVFELAIVDQPPSGSRR